MRGYRREDPRQGNRCVTGRELITALSRVTFPCGSATKRFVRDMNAKPADYVLSQRGEAWAWRIAYICRRQLPVPLREEAERRKVDHQWISHETASGSVYPKMFYVRYFGIFQAYCERAVPWSRQW